MKQKDIDKMIDILGQNKNRFQTKMIMHQLLKMTLAESDPSINDALSEFAGTIPGLETAEFED